MQTNILQSGFCAVFSESRLCMFPWSDRCITLSWSNFFLSCFYEVALQSKSGAHWSSCLMILKTNQRHPENTTIFMFICACLRTWTYLELWNYIHTHHTSNYCNHEWQFTFYSSHIFLYATAVHSDESRHAAWSELKTCDAQGELTCENGRHWACRSGQWCGYTMIYVYRKTRLKWCK